MFKYTHEKRLRMKTSPPHPLSLSLSRSLRQEIKSSNIQMSAHNLKALFFRVITLHWKDFRIYTCEKLLMLHLHCTRWINRNFTETKKNVNNNYKLLSFVAHFKITLRLSWTMHQLSSKIFEQADVATFNKGASYIRYIKQNLRGVLQK